MQRRHSVVIDLSVVIHQMHQCLVSDQVPKEHYEGYVKAQLAWMMSCDWLGDLKGDRGIYQVFLVQDSKPYWRTEYLERPEVLAAIPRKTKAKQKKADRLQALLTQLQGHEAKIPTPESVQDDIAISEELSGLLSDLAIVYKGGRKFPEYSFTKLKKFVYQVCEEQGWNLLAGTGYEADDLAAAIVVMNSAFGPDDQQDITLATVDADWLGLLSDRVQWFCLHGWSPRLRQWGTTDTNGWCQKRLGGIPATPEDIWTLKVAHGDKSDNLPPGCPLEVISLLQPPVEHRLWLDGFYSRHISRLLNGQDRPNVPDVDKATDYLRRLGCPRFIRSYEV